MAAWKFQLLPAKKDLLGVGFRMDAAGTNFEKQVNDALRYPFRFHGVNKLVLELGRTDPPKRDYAELLGVGIKQCPEFDLDLYARLSDADRFDALRSQTIQVFKWLQNSFPDAEFVGVGLRNLGWDTTKLQ